MKNKGTEEVSLLIIDWYREHKRSLPWRDTCDPYKIWVSEIILQQTRVAQGLDYYLRFIGRFPTVAALAAAEDDEVMRLWQGLGYYSRARNLHKAARMVAAGGGCFPQSYAGVRALPGIGDYTAAAICSMAYGLPYAVVDGNVYRVLARCFGIGEPIDTAQGKKYFSALASELLPAGCPGLYNQAIMDFGALQCVPQSPDCGSCPLEAKCVACAERRVEEFPVKARRQRVPDVYLHYIYVRVGDAVCLRRRASELPGGKKKPGLFSPSIWQGLYELPLVVAEQPLAPEEFLGSEDFGRFFLSDAERQSASVSLLRREVLHRLSHRVLHLNFYSVQLPPDSLSFPGFLRVPHSELPAYPVPRPIAALWKELGL